MTREKESNRQKWKWKKKSIETDRKVDKGIMRISSNTEGEKGKHKKKQIWKEKKSIKQKSLCRLDVSTCNESLLSTIVKVVKVNASSFSHLNCGATLSHIY